MLRTMWGKLGVIVMLAGVAQAEPTARPWAAGVSDEHQARALELLGRGNEQMDRDDYAKAVEIYREAVAVWDHPAIRYNLALAEIHLDRPREADEDLARALRYPEALEPEIRQQAVVYQRLVHAQVVRLTVDCVDPGTHIELDGKPVEGTCPGTLVQSLLPGPHHLIATKPGYVTRTIDHDWSGGSDPHEKIDLMTYEEATVTRRRWARWKPWAITGAGLAIAGVGLGFELQSAATFRSYDKAVAVLCPDHPCAPPQLVTDAYSDARRDNKIAIGLFVAGGATLAAGGVLLWLNREIAEQVGYEHAPVVTASFGRNSSSVAVQASF